MCSKDWRCRARQSFQDIAMADSRRVGSTLAAVPVLFAHNVFTVANNGCFVNICVCVYWHVYMCIRAYVHAHMRAYMYAYTHTYTCIHIYLFFFLHRACRAQVWSLCPLTCVCVVCVCVCVVCVLCVCVCVCVCCVCVCANIHTYMFVCIHSYIHRVSGGTHL